MIRYTLSPEDEDWALRVGTHRNTEATSLKASAAFDPARTLRAHILGAMAELAFCRAIGLEWPHRDHQWETGLPDVDPLWEVRWSSNPNKVKVREAPKAKGKNRFRFSDNPELQVVHVTGRPPSFQIVGFIVAGWVQQNRPLEDPNNAGRPAHFVDAFYLTPINVGFHTICAYADLPFLGGWTCLYCGKPFEGSKEEALWPSAMAT